MNTISLIVANVVIVAGLCAFAYIALWILVLGVKDFGQAHGRFLAEVAERGRQVDATLARRRGHVRQS